MYHQYFGLTESAFSIAVNPKYLYMSRQHREAIAHLLYGIKGGGFVLLSGEVGTGKTTIIRQVLNQLPAKTEVAFILNPMAEIHALLETICEELKLSSVNSESSIKHMMDALQQHLLVNFSEGKRTVLIIDEAQLLSADILEQIRLLTNLETENEKLLQIILVGQPEINAVLSQPRLRQLSQRITARFNLQPLNEKETDNYIKHRLHVAGLKEDRVIFPKGIIRKIHRFSDGVPRLINIICERSLIGAYGHNAHKVSHHVFQLALNEIKGVKHTTNSSRFIPAILASMLAAAMLATGITLYFNSEGSSAEIVAKSVASKISKNEEEIKSEIPPKTETTTSTVKAVNPAEKLDRAEEANEFFESKSEALRALFDYYNVPLEYEKNPCWLSDKHLLHCNRETLEAWQNLSELNRPSILTLVTEEKNLAYAFVIGMNERDLLLVDTDNQVIQHSKDQIGKFWNGDVVYLWRKPENYSGPLSAGMSSPTVAWVAEQFAIIDEQTRPITDDVFSLKLKTRVQIFQSNNALESDGLIGERTIMKLNEKAGLSPSLLKSLDRDER